MDINGTTYKATLTGWRVLSVEGTGDNKYVRLVSAGIPLSYDHISGATLAQSQTSVERLTTKFFETEIKSTSTDTYFNLCGFKNGSTTINTIAALKTLFQNNYTQTTSLGYPAVSSLTKADVDIAYYGDSNNDGVPDQEIADGEELAKRDLFHLLASGYSSTYVPYFLAGYTKYNTSYYMWSIYVQGIMVCTSGNHGIRPVVSLKPTVETSGQSNGVWQLQ